MLKLLKFFLFSLMFFISSLPLFSQPIKKIFLKEPQNGQITSSKPAFKILIEGDAVPRYLKFKIELSRNDFDSVFKIYDQVSERKGWSYHQWFDEEIGGIYRAQEPLPDGVYQWKAYVYDGLSYFEGEATSSFIVDSIPPEEVRGLQVHHDHETGYTHLEWEPILLDVNGMPESISHYNIYRYEKKSIFFVIRVFFIGSTEVESFVDKDTIKNKRGKLIFYKVVGVDKAGNELGKRY